MVMKNTQTKKQNEFQKKFKKRKEKYKKEQQKNNFILLIIAERLPHNSAETVPFYHEQLQKPIHHLLPFSRQ